ncbi:uncharacterized protein V1518DRAFT_422876 [Limtongia smithiae]|uniref:uncharacterized protein n=1 Tax=Limtongia smithiae TaxID=1125753 RepID=UPI0034CDA35F
MQTSFGGCLSSHSSFFTLHKPSPQPNNNAYAMTPPSTLLSLPDELLLLIYASFAGSDFYGSVLVCRRLNRLLTREMYRRLKLYLPEASEDGEDACGWERDACLVNLFADVSLDECEQDRKGSGALLKRTFKESPALARCVTDLTVIGAPLYPTLSSSDEITAFPTPPDAALRGVRSLLAHMTALESLVFDGDPAQLSAFIYAVPRTITALSLRSASRLQFGDVYLFRSLRRLCVHGVPEAGRSKSVMWESCYAIRMLLEQNAGTLEELVLGAWNLDMLFESYVPVLPRLKCLVFELVAGDADTAPAWGWLPDLIAPSRASSLKVFFTSCQPPPRLRGIDWKALHRLEGRRRIKRKLQSKGHSMTPVVDWATGEAREGSVLMELTIRRHRPL